MIPLRQERVIIKDRLHVPLRALSPPSLAGDKEAAVSPAALWSGGRRWGEKAWHLWDLSLVVLHLHHAELLWVLLGILPDLGT